MEGIEELSARLIQRSKGANLPLSERNAKRLSAYLELLGRWNRRINLTALPLEPPSPEALDRLILEPLAAATLLPPSLGEWADAGSGGGSPAIPLHIVKPGGTLVMVESRERKAAFLREAVRALELDRASVCQSRFEDLPLGAVGPFDWITVRAVRPDGAFFSVASRILRHDGKIVLFGAEPGLETMGSEFRISKAQVFQSFSCTISILRRV